MFERLEEVNRRPRPFEAHTARELWTDPHTSKRMLAAHLDETVDAASRNRAFLDRSAAWITARFELESGAKVVDFGCGPGLYAQRLARAGADVLGLDFSQRSIDYAEAAAVEEGLAISYMNVDYLEFEASERFDLVLMIMCDYCALSPAQRRGLLRTFRSILRPEGSVLLDVYSPVSFDRRREATVFEAGLLDGFWSPGPYYGFLNTFKYEREKLTLDKYTIVEPDRTRTIYNWLQCFDQPGLEAELAACGLGVEEYLADVAGAPYDPDAEEFAVIARAM